MITTTIFLPSQNDTCNEFISRVQCQVQIHISCTLHLREVKCIYKSLTCKVFALVLLEENIFTKWKVHSLVSYYYSTNVILVVSSLYPLSIVIVNPLLYGCSPRDWINFFCSIHQTGPCFKMSTSYLNELSITLTSGNRAELPSLVRVSCVAPEIYRL